VLNRKEESGKGKTDGAGKRRQAGEQAWRLSTGNKKYKGVWMEEERISRGLKKREIQHPMKYQRGGLPRLGEEKKI